MKLSNYLRKLNPSDREAFAKRIAKRVRGKTSVEYLYLIAGEHRNPSVNLALAIEFESQGEVARGELLPKVYGVAVFKASRSVASGRRTKVAA